MAMFKNEELLLRPKRKRLIEVVRLRLLGGGDRDRCGLRD
jgi:hypothetical protein